MARVARAGLATVGWHFPVDNQPATKKLICRHALAVEAGSEAAYLQQWLCQPAIS